MTRKQIYANCCLMDIPKAVGPILVIKTNLMPDSKPVNDVVVETTCALFSFGVVFCKYRRVRVALLRGRVMFCVFGTVGLSRIRVSNISVLR